MKKVTSAGGIVLRNEDGQLKILLVGHRSGMFSFPKGHQEFKETLEQTAIREVKEETGLLQVRIVKKLGMFTRPSKEDTGEIVMKDIHMYLMETSDYTSENAELKTAWLQLEEASKYFSFEAEKAFLLSVMPQLKTNT